MFTFLNPTRIRHLLVKALASVVLPAIVVTSLATLGMLASETIAQDRFGGLDQRDRGGISDRWQGNGWLSGVNSTEQWVLGVRGDSTDTGFLITQVLPGSAAEQARLQPRDRIVALEGFQVGQVAGRIYDLEQEINRRTGPGGLVSCLIYDGQTGRLASINIQLSRSGSHLSGVVVSPQMLPADAIVTVQINNVTRPNWGVRNGQQVLSGANLRSIPFRISYDPQFIAQQDQYQVRAIVSSGGRDIMYSAPVRVITQGAPSEVQLNLEGNLAALANAGNNGNFMSAGYVNYNQLDQQVVSLYREYLGRSPSAGELAAARVLGTNTSNIIERLPLRLMASQEYFDLARNDNDFWLANVFGVLVGRPPRADEIAQWRRRFSELRFSRTELLRELKMASI